MTTCDFGTDFGDVKRFFGYQDDGCTSSETGIHRNPSRISTHQLNDHDTIMTFGRGVKSINCIRGDLYRSVKSKREFSSKNIIVNCFRDTNNWQMSFGK